MRSTSIRPKRSKPRRGQPTSRQTKEVRLGVYGRSGGRCELNLHPECIRGILPFAGPDPLSHGHLVHLHAKRRFGTSMENCAWGCYKCHLISLHNPKPCPPKPAMEKQA